MKTFFRTEIGTPFSNGGQHDTEESLREFMRALEADMVCDILIPYKLMSSGCHIAVLKGERSRWLRRCGDLQQSGVTHHSCMHSWLVSCRDQGHMY